MSKKEFPFVVVEATSMMEFDKWNTIRKYGNYMSTEAQVKAQLIKNALKVVDELADLEITDIADIEDLIEKAEKIKKNRHWKLN
jgi:CO dehydrogenase/acetyl-CoA synthase beta subunit